MIATMMAFCQFATSLLVCKLKEKKKKVYPGKLSRNYYPRTLLIPSYHGRIINRSGIVGQVIGLKSPLYLLWQ